MAKTFVVRCENGHLAIATTRYGYFTHTEDEVIESMCPTCILDLIRQKWREFKR